MRTFPFFLVSASIAVAAACGGQTSSSPESGDSGPDGASSSGSSSGSSGSSSGGSSSSSSSGAAGQSFPFPGPSCASSDSFYGDACWQCSVARCGGACETTACAAYFSCFCACDPNGPPATDAGLSYETACQAACDPLQAGACAQCRSTLGQCQAEKCEPACGYVDAGTVVTGTPARP